MEIADTVQGTGGSMVGNMVLAAGVMVLVLTMMLRLRRRARRREEEPAAVVGSERIRERAKAGADVVAADHVRHAAALMENRMVALEALIRVADERISTLRLLEDRAAAHRGRVSPRQGGDPGREVVPVNEAPARVRTSSRISVATRADRARPGTPDELRHAVRELAGEGFPAHEIAGRLGEPIGTVELVLALDHVGRAHG